MFKHSYLLRALCRAPSMSTTVFVRRNQAINWTAVRWATTFGRASDSQTVSTNSENPPVVDVEPRGPEPRVSSVGERLSDIMQDKEPTFEEEEAMKREKDATSSYPGWHTAAYDGKPTGKIDTLLDYTDEKFRDKWPSTGTAIRDSVNELGQNAKNIYDAAKDKTTEAKTQAQNAAGISKDRLEDMKERAKDVYDAAASEFQDKTKDLKKTVKEGVEMAKDMYDDAKTKAKEKGTSTIDEVKNKVDDATKTVKTKLVKDAVEHAAKSNIQAAVDKAKDVGAKVASTVKSTIEGAKELFTSATPEKTEKEQKTVSEEQLESEKERESTKKSKYDRTNYD